MAAGEKIAFAEAFEVARAVADELRPHVARIKAAGSLRRRRPRVGDLEFVIEPRTLTDLFGEARPDVDAVRQAAGRLGAVTKAGLRYIRVERVLDSVLSCDLFLVHPPAQWGSILAIRTGPARLGHYAMLRLYERGLRHVNGHIETPAGEVVPTPEEADFFRAAGLPCLPPNLRDTDAAFLDVPANAR